MRRFVNIRALYSSKRNIPVRIRDKGIEFVFMEPIMKNYAKILFHIFFSYTLIIGFFGCTSNKNIKGNIVNISDLNDDFTLASDRQIENAYRISPGDQITVQVFKRSDLSQTLPVTKYSVRKNGVISVPLVGNIHAGGLTIEELETQILKKLANTMVEPIVHVVIDHRSNQKILIAGQVKNPGIYPLEHNTSVLEGILLAGGATKDADRSTVVLISTRPVKANEKNGTNAFTVDIEKFLTEQRFDQNIVLRRGDIIFVPDSFLAQSGRLWNYIGKVVQPFADVFGIVSSVVILSNTSGQSQ